MYNTDLVVVQLSDVSELAAALKLVVSGMSSADIEMKFSTVGNVGWAAEVVNDWNSAESHPPAAKMLKSSSLQSTDNDSGQLQCSMFCMYYYVTFFAVYCLSV